MLLAVRDVIYSFVSLLFLVSFIAGVQVCGHTISILMGLLSFLMFNVSGHIPDMSFHNLLGDLHLLLNLQRPKEENCLNDGLFKLKISWLTELTQYSCPRLLPGVGFQKKLSPNRKK